jgi:DNA polymerase-3 subunit alpha
MYSLLDGYSTPEEYLERAKEVGLKAFAITEHGNEYSWCYFDKLKEKYPEIKMIYGVEMYECFDRSICDKTSKYFHLVVLAKNEKGRKALNHLVTLSNLEGFYYKPRIQLSDFEGYGNDLVVSSACLASKLAREEDYQKCIEYIREYKKVFPHFFLEMQAHSSPEQAEYNKKILNLANGTSTPFIITTDSHAARKEDLYYQGQLVSIARDSETASEIYEGCYVQTIEEIHEVMDSQIGYANVERGLTTTNLVADIIENVSMPFQSPQLPTFPLPEGFNDNYSYLTYLTEQGWLTRGIDKLSKNEQAIYRERLEYEKNIIHTMGFDGYFLIVWDFINWAKTHGVKVGAGRGSGAGSLVCFLMGITDLNPIKYGLVFERFLNPERISMPDLDIDLSDRGKVVDYLVSKYGNDRVCQVINFSYITPVVAIKDVGKTLGFPFKEMDKLSKKFSYQTFDECLEHNDNLLDEHPEYKELFDIASHLSGRVKTVSIHAGGVGIVDTTIDNYMAMKLGTDDEHVIQVDKRIIEEIGIIKFDLLGVATLNLLTEVQEDTSLSDYDLDINNPKFEQDKSPYEILCKAMTDGVFQVESAGMKDLLIRLQPSSMEDLSAVLALYRPDSMGALEEFIECKHNPSKVKYIHPDMKPILESTYGQCIAKNEMVSTPKGNIKIQDIKCGDIIYTASGEKKVNRIWCNGNKNIFKITLRNNKTLKCTDNHRLLTSNGWKEIKDLSYSDVVAIRVGNNNSQKYDINKLKMIGYLLGDGCFRESNFIHFYNTNIDIAIDFKQVVETAYPNTYVMVQGKDVPSGSYVYDCTIRSRGYYEKKYDLLQDVSDWGFKNKLSIEKEIPKFVFGLDTESILTVLGVYLDTDGSYTSRGHIRFKTGSCQLAFDIQELIRLIGFTSHVYSHSDKEYDICVHNSHRLYDMLKPYSYKLNNAPKCNTIDKDMTNVIPLKEVANYINKYLKVNNISARQAHRETGCYIFRQYNSQRAKQYGYVQINSLVPIKDVCNLPDEWFDKNLKWERIKNIENLNEVVSVYDIEVEEEHNFVVNGIVVHNCIYQEQIMEIVRQFGGRTYGGADRYRKAIGKKMPELVKEESKKLYQEIIDNGYSEEVAKAISDELAAKGGYCFNKSHSYSYAVLCFQTAFLKQNYPLQFFKALLNLNIDKAGMVNKYIIDSQNFNITVTKPHINHSVKNFSIYNSNILFGLSAISGIGEKLSESIIEERTCNGKYTDMNNFISRVPVTTAQIVSLIKSGAFPTKNKKKCLINYLKSSFPCEPFKYKPVSTYKTKKEMLEVWGIDVDKYKENNKVNKEAVLEEYNKRREKQMRSEYYIKREMQYKDYIQTCSDRYLPNETFWEFEALQIFLSNNPFEKAYKYLRPFENIEEGESCVLVGVISKVQKKKTKTGNQFAFVNIYSSTGLIEAIVWSTELKQHEDLIRKGNQIAMKCIKENESQVKCESIKSYSKWLQYAERKLNKE